MVPNLIGLKLRAATPILGQLPRGESGAVLRLAVIRLPNGGFRCGMGFDEDRYSSTFLILNNPIGWFPAKSLARWVRYWLLRYEHLAGGWKKSWPSLKASYLAPHRSSVILRCEVAGIYNSCISKITFIGATTISANVCVKPRLCNNPLPCPIS